MSKIKASDYFRPTPKDWDPLEGAAHGADQSGVLQPAALRLFEAEVDKLRRKRELREQEDMVWTDE